MCVYYLRQLESLKIKENPEELSPHTLPWVPVCSGIIFSLDLECPGHVHYIPGYKSLFCTNSSFTDSYLE